MYHSMVFSIIAFDRHDADACALHMSLIASKLGSALAQYYDRLHDKSIAISAWLQYVQGIHAWGVGHHDATSGQWVTYDGLSGNQVLLFQALDAFIGIEPYLSLSDQELNMPVRQRRLCRSLERHCFRFRLEELGSGESESERSVKRSFTEIVRLLKAGLRFLMPWCIGVPISFSPPS